MGSTNFLTLWPTWAPYFKSILRIVAASMFMMAGTMKLFGFPAPMPHGAAIAFPSQIWFAAILETFGGGLLLLGLCTRPIAFLLSGEMAVAYFQVHFQQGPWPVLNMGQTAVLYCFIWLFFSAAGAGPWSLDAMRGKG